MGLGLGMRVGLALLGVGLGGTPLKQAEAQGLQRVPVPVIPTR